MDSSLNRIKNNSRNRRRGKRKREKPYPARPLRKTLKKVAPREIIIEFRKGLALKLESVNSVTKDLNVSLLGNSVGGQAWVSALGLNAVVKTQ